MCCGCGSRSCHDGPRPGRWTPVSLVPIHPIVNGQLYRETGAAPVYLAQDQQLFWIPTPDALVAMGFGWNVNVVPDGSLARPGGSRHSTGSGGSDRAGLPARHWILLMGGEFRPARARRQVTRQQAPGP